MIVRQLIFAWLIATYLIGAAAADSRSVTPQTTPQTTPQPMSLPATQVAIKTVTQIVTTQRPAEELLPVLMPLAGNEVSLQAYRGQLIVSGPATRVEVLLAVLAQLDRPTRNMRISVRKISTEMRRSRELQSQIDSQGAHIRLGSDLAQSGGGDQQQLVVREGDVARLSLDQEILTSGVTAAGAPSEKFLPLGNQLELNPQWADGQIRLEIVRRDAQLQSENSLTIASQGVQSVLLLTPGQWTPFASVSSAGNDGGRSISGAIEGDQARGTYRNGRVGHFALQNWEVRVDVMDP